MYKLFHAYEKQTIIFDVGSASLSNNDKFYYDRLVDMLCDLFPIRYWKRVVLKAQLFVDRLWGVLLDRRVFEYFKSIAQKEGFQVTASVFDQESLEYLIEDKNIPFVKIAAIKELYPLIAKVPRKTAVVVSVTDSFEWSRLQEAFPDTVLMACVRQYPSLVKQYEGMFQREVLREGISDHSIRDASFALFDTYNPRVYERHIALNETRKDKDRMYASYEEDIKELNAICHKKLSSSETV